MNKLILSMSLMGMMAMGQQLPVVIGATSTDVKILQMTPVYVSEHPDRVTLQGGDFGAAPGRVQIGMAAAMVDMTAINWTPSTVTALLPGKLPPGTYLVRLQRPDGKSSEMPLVIDNPDTGAKLFMALSGRICKPGEFVSGFTSTGSPICTVGGPPAPTSSVFTYNITGQLSSGIQSWSGATRMFGDAQYGVVVKAPSGRIDVAGDTWIVQSVTGFAGCTIVPARPYCFGETSTLHSNGRPVCGGAAPARGGNSTAAATITCQR